MKVVIDTNCLLRCVGKKSSYRNVFDAFLRYRYTLCASAEIFFEYEETFFRFWDTEVTENLMGLFQHQMNVERIEVSFNWRLVNKNEDHNKFVDCYIAANADYLVSNDSAIIQLKGTRFQPLAILTLEEFSELLATQSAV